jgi:hypothetical protein
MVQAQGGFLGFGCRRVPVFRAGHRQQRLSRLAVHHRWQRRVREAYPAHCVQRQVRSGGGDG